MSPPLSDLAGFSPLLASELLAMADSPLPGWGEGGLERDEGEEGEGAVDHFDRLPDSVLLLVFNSIGDVKVLGRCCAVSRRFHSLVPLVDDVLVRVDCVISDDDDDRRGPNSADASSSGDAPASSCAADKPSGLFSHLARLVLGGIVRPLQAIGHILAIPSGGAAGEASLSSSSAVCNYERRHPAPPANAASSSETAPSDVSHHSPTEVLRNFREIRRLRIELPAGELGVDDGVLLKWKADFGSTLNSCVILGASSMVSSKEEAPSSLPTDKSAHTNDAGGGAGDGFCSVDGAAGSVWNDNGTIPESFYTNGSLKLRVVWTISSLIAASARHYLLQPIIADHGTLESLDLVDADGQGVLRMDREQLEELRVKPVSASGFSQRTLVPALNMRLWYAQHLELSGGVVLKGATLVAIRPIENLPDQMTTEVATVTAGAQQDLSWVTGAFEEPYGSAVRQLVKRRMYCLEMNSF